MARPSAVILIFFVCFMQMTAAAEASDLFDADTGFRISRYRTPTPESVPGGKLIDIDELDRLVSTKSAILIDVMMAEGAGYDASNGTWRLSKLRENIPGSVWLPDVGRGRLDEVLDRYFRENLARLTNDNKARAIILYCLADCWMSWNAVQRAASYGYTQIYWYPGGTDGWRDWDRKLVTATPVPVTISTKTTTKSNNPMLPSGTKAVTLISADGARRDIADISFEPGTSSDSVEFSIQLRSTVFQDNFLSMRAFQCMPDKKEMWCHLAYPYETKKEISESDLQDLEYALLFLFKPPTAYGIDAWNGLYFKMQLETDGRISGTLHETDLNALAVPPEAGNQRPIGHSALSEIESGAHRFARIEIR